MPLPHRTMYSVNDVILDSICNVWQILKPVGLKRYPVHRVRRIES
jgi:hypothetical protein